MKNVLKFILIFVLGLAAGSGITGFAMNKYHRNYMAEIYSMNVGTNAMLAQYLKGGNAEIVLQYTEKNLIEEVQNLYENEELRRAATADISLWAAKRFYVCTKTPYPSEIDAVMNALPPFPESSCNIQED